MPRESALPRRRTLRLPGFDYGSNRTYFVTLVIQNRLCLLSQVENEAIALTEPGRRADFWWQALAERFPMVRLGAYVLMPNHLHALVSIVEEESAGGHVGPPLPPLGPASAGGHAGPPLPPPTLPRLVQWFKTMSTNEYLRRIGEPGWQPIRRRLWQRSFYEHVVRSEEALGRIQDYIAANPTRWPEDSENPARLAP